jgi:hypothetical protein
VQVEENNDNCREEKLIIIMTMIFQLGTKQNRYFAGDFAVTILQLNKPNHR